MAAALEEIRPDIVFVTAFSQYATDAFLIEATDYLLKPLKPERLRLAIDRARRRQSERRAVQAASKHVDPARQSLNPLEPTQWAQESLHIPSRQGGTDLAQSEIIWIEAAKGYMLIHTILRSHILRTTMAELANKLRPSIVRAHRSAFVAIESIHRWRSLGEGSLSTHDDGWVNDFSQSHVQKECKRLAESTAVVTYSDFSGTLELMRYTPNLLRSLENQEKGRFDHSRRMSGGKRSSLCKIKLFRG